MKPVSLALIGAVLGALIGALIVSPAHAQTSEPELRIPPSKASIDLDGQSIEITAWGTVSARASGPLALALTVDLGGLQDHLTPALAAQLNASDPCGERLAVESAALTPEAPASVLTAHVNYERYACAKAFGKQVTKKLAGGHGVIELKLTPEVADNNISLDAEVRKLEVRKLDADGSLGALLRSGALGDALRQDIGDSVESAIQKAADLKKIIPQGALPAAIRNAIAIRSIQFADGGTGRLWLNVAGEVRLSAEELRRALAQ